MRTCSTCQRSLDLSFFYKDRTKKDGYKCQCRECRAEAKREWNRKNKHLSRQYYKENKERCKKNSRKSRFSKYGITEQQYLVMYETQKGRCLICNDWVARLHIDHDHKNGKMRGLLCGPCNRGLGHFRDSLDFLSKAIKYLRSTMV